MHDEMGRARNTTEDEVTIDISSLTLSEIERCHLIGVFEKLLTIIIYLAENMHSPQQFINYAIKQWQFSGANGINGKV